jgi:hypothetical protein
MPDETLWDYEAFDANADLAPEGHCVMTFRTAEGSVLVRMERIVFEGLVKKAEQALESGTPPAI